MSRKIIPSTKSLFEEPETDSLKPFILVFWAGTLLALVGAVVSAIGHYAGNPPTSYSGLAAAIAGFSISLSSVNIGNRAVSRSLDGLRAALGHVTVQYRWTYPKLGQAIRASSTIRLVSMSLSLDQQSRGAEWDGGDKEGGGKWDSAKEEALKSCKDFRYIFGLQDPFRKQTVDKVCREIAESTEKCDYKLHPLESRGVLLKMFPALSRDLPFPNFLILESRRGGKYVVLILADAFDNPERWLTFTDSNSVGYFEACFAYLWSKADDYSFINDGAQILEPEVTKVGPEEVKDGASPPDGFPMW